jgi:hypothetical protein
MQEVNRENLVPCKEYYLQCFEPSCEAPNKPYKMIAKFEKLIQSYWNPNWYWACFNNFRNIEHRNDPSCIRRVELGYHWKFYEIPRNKVQKNMENRAYNMVLLDLIQDEYFKPVDIL